MANVAEPGRISELPRQGRDRNACDDTAHPEQGLQQARHPDVAFGTGQHRGPGLDRAEDDPDPELAPARAAPGPGSAAEHVSRRDRGRRPGTKLAVSWSANQVPKTASSTAAATSAAAGSISAASAPTTAGPSTKDASSAEPSYEKAASTSRRWSRSSARWFVSGRHRTRASGPI